MVNPNPNRVSATLALCTLAIAGCNQSQPVAQTTDAVPPGPEPQMEGRTIQPQGVTPPTESVARPETLARPQISPRPATTPGTRTATAAQPQRFRQPRIASATSLALAARQSSRLPMIAASPTRLPPLTARRATLPLSSLMARSPQIPRSAAPQPATAPQVTPPTSATQPQASLFLNPQTASPGNPMTPGSSSLTPQQAALTTPVQPLQPIQPIPTQLTPVPSETGAATDSSSPQAAIAQNGEPLPSMSTPERLALTPNQPAQGAEAMPSSSELLPSNGRSTPITPIAPEAIRPPQEVSSSNRLQENLPTGPKQDTHTSHSTMAQPGAIAVRSNLNPAAITNPSYVLGAGDRLYIAIAGAPQLSGERQVGDDGTLMLPGAGSLRVSGMTLAKATTEVAERYSAQVRVPRVAIALMQARPLRVSIGGEVNRPGFYRLPVGHNQQPPNLMQALQIARGVTQTADLQKVQVQRQQRSGAPQVITLDLREIMQGDQKQDLSLRDGDIILVPNTAWETVSQNN